MPRRLSFSDASSHPYRTYPTMATFQLFQRKRPSKKLAKGSRQPKDGKYAIAAVNDSRSFPVDAKKMEHSRLEDRATFTGARHMSHPKRLATEAGWPRGISAAARRSAIRWAAPLTSTMCTRLRTQEGWLRFLILPKRPPTILPRSTGQSVLTVRWATR